MRTVNVETHARQRQRILNTACSLFAGRGFAETSMEAIAKACRMKKPSLYHYFKSKEALLHELLRSRTGQDPKKLAALHCRGNLRATFFRIGMDFMKSMDQRSNRDFLQLMLRNAASDRFVRRAFVAVISGRIREAIRSFGQRSAVPGHNRAVGIAIHQFLGSLIRYVTETRLWKLKLMSQISDREYVGGLADIFAHGLRPRHRIS